MALIDDVKQVLRVSTDSLDTEIQDLIETAKAEMILSGVDSDKIVDTDALIKRCVSLYCKANFGIGNEDSEKYQMSYEGLLKHLCVSTDYKASEEE